MREIRYSVFISSTYEDLKEERKAVQEAVLSAGDFPIQMESFPAADVDQLEFIKPLIDKSDYYILIVAGRYGTPTDNGVSYTEKEYDYAKSKNIPVLVMLRSHREELPGNKMEATDRGKKLLTKFIQKASTGCMRKEWTNSGELKHEVGTALANAKITHPRTGWVRGDATSNDDILREFTEVRKENKQFREELEHNEDARALPLIPAVNDPLVIVLISLSAENAFSGDHPGDFTRISCTWFSAFSVFSKALVWGMRIGDLFDYFIDIKESLSAIGAAFEAEVGKIIPGGTYVLNRRDFDRMLSYYIETGLMEEKGHHPFTDVGKKALRRYQIASTTNGSFSIVKGELSEKPV